MLLAVFTLVTGHVLSDRYRRSYRLLLCAFVAFGALLYGGMEAMEADYQARQR